MSKSVLWTEVSRVVDRYISNEIMLDALLQWASNPTSKSAGYGLKENYPCIAKNLAARHGIPLRQAENCVAELRNHCESLEEKADKQAIQPLSRIGEIQGTLREALTQEAPQRLLRQGVMKRLREVSEETRRALLVFILLENTHSPMGPDVFGKPPEPNFSPQSTFQAYYKSIFGGAVPADRVADEMIRCGACSNLYYVPTPHAKSRAREELVKAKEVFPTEEEIATAGTRLPSPPEIPALIESHWHEGNWDFLRLVDILSHSPGGVATIEGIDEPLRAKIDVPGFMGTDGHTVALSPVIAAETERELGAIKREKMADNRHRVDDALAAIVDKLGPGATRQLLWRGEGEVLWIVESIKFLPLYVYFAPWLTTSTQSRELSHIRRNVKPSGLFIIPCQSRPSFLCYLERYFGFSPKDTRQEKSLSLLSGLGAPWEFHLLAGQEHPLVGRIVEVLAGHMPAQPPARLVPPEPGPSAQPTPATPPPHAPQLLLGDRVAAEDIRRLSQRELSEDDRRQGLSALGEIVYPLAAATTHTAIFGTTGSGKSVTTKRLVRELVRHGIPVTIIDWHDEYVEVMRDLGGMVAIPPTSTTKPRSGEEPFTWNMLDLRFYSVEATQQVIEDYVEIVVDLLAPKGLLELTEPMKGGLTEALKLQYQNRTVPTLKEVEAVIAKVSIPPATANALQRRLRQFSGGSLGSIFCSQTSFDPAQMFMRPMAVRVKHLTADHQSAVGLLTFFLLRQAVSHFKRMGEVGSDAPVRHVIVIDEAPMVIGSNPKVEHEVVRMLQEVRKFGEGLILVCRNPGVSDDILRETNTKIAHKLDVPKDVTSVSDMLGLAREDRALLRSLPRGVAFARIAGNRTALVRIKAA